MSTSNHRKTPVAQTFTAVGRSRDLSWESASACGRSRSGVTPWGTTVLTCVNCRLKDECLDDALESAMRGRTVMGVAGGLTQGERNSVLRLAASKQIFLDRATA